MKSAKNNKLNLKRLLMWGSYLSVMVLAGVSVADATTLGGVASSITQSMTQVSKLITSTSYVAGLGFAIGSIMKFKQHKDNPTQIPIGTPIALLFIAAALLFLPSILGIAGQTMFGTSGTVAGPTGTIFS